MISTHCARLSAECEHAAFRHQTIAQLAIDIMPDGECTRRSDRVALTGDLELKFWLTKTLGIICPVTSGWARLVVIAALPQVVFITHAAAQCGALTVAGGRLPARQCDNARDVSTIIQTNCYRYDIVLIAIFDLAI